MDDNPGMIALKLTRVGNSIGLVLPKEVLSRLQVVEGDTILLTETPDGYQITTYNAAKRSALSRLEQGAHLGGGPLASRDELHDRTRLR